MQLLSSRLEDTILTFLLLNGSVETGELLVHIQKKSSCTKQGFYKALRKLKVEDRVVVYQSSVSVNELWRKQIQALVEQGDGNSSILGDFSTLVSGEEINLTLKGLTAMDQVWAHVFSVIENKVSKTEHLFLFNPHNWSSILRAEADTAHDSLLGQQGRKAYLSIGSVSILDKLATRNLAFANIEVSYSQMKKQEAYIAVLGDYTIEVRFNPVSRRAIDLLFNTEIDAVRAKWHLKKLDKKVISKIVIAKDSRKANEWKRRISKNFFIPR